MTTRKRRRPVLVTVCADGNAHATTGASACIYASNTKTEAARDKQMADEHTCGPHTIVEYLPKVTPEVTGKKR